MIGMQKIVNPAVKQKTDKADKGENLLVLKGAQLEEHV